MERVELSRVPNGLERFWYLVLTITSDKTPVNMAGTGYDVFTTYYFLFFFFIENKACHFI